MKAKDQLPLTEFDKLFDQNKHHIAELLFFDDEIKFLNDLLDGHFFQQLQEEHASKVKLIHNSLIQLHMVKENIAKDVLTHQGNLMIKMKDIVNHDIYFFRVENERIVAELNDLNKLFRNIKKDIFSLSKNLHNQKLMFN